MNENKTDDETVAIPKEQFDILLTRSNVELIQRVNHLINLVERLLGDDNK